MSEIKNIIRECLMQESKFTSAVNLMNYINGGPLSSTNGIIKEFSNFLNDINHELKKIASSHVPNDSIVSNKIIDSKVGKLDANLDRVNLKLKEAKEILHEAYKNVNEISDIIEKNK